MKTGIFLFIFLLLSICETDAQTRFKAGVKLGLSTSQVEGDTYGGFNKVGVAGGGTMNAKLNDKWSAQFEILFVQKGSKHAGDPNQGDFSFYVMQLNYVEVPVLLEYKQKKFTFEAGPGFGYLINAREEDYYSTINNPIPFNTTEVSASIGITYQVYKRLGINWRYTNSLLPIRKYASGASFWYNPGQRNNVITFTATYSFGSAESE